MILATVIALSTLILAVRSGAVIALRWHFLNSRAEPATNNAAAVNASRLCADRFASHEQEGANLILVGSDRVVFEPAGFGGESDVSGEMVSPRRDSPLRGGRCMRRLTARSRRSRATRASLWPTPPMFAIKSLSSIEVRTSCVANAARRSHGRNLCTGSSTCRCRAYLRRLGSVPFATKARHAFMAQARAIIFVNSDDTPIAATDPNGEVRPCVCTSIGRAYSAQHDNEFPHSRWCRCALLVDQLCSAACLPCRQGALCFRWRVWA